MALVRKSAAEAWAAGNADLAKVDATTEVAIRQQMAEDGEIAIGRRSLRAATSYKQMVQIKRNRLKKTRPGGVKATGKKLSTEKHA